MKLLLLLACVNQMDELEKGVKTPFSLKFVVDLGLKERDEGDSRLRVSFEFTVL